MHGLQKESQAKQLSLSLFVRKCTNLSKIYILYMHMIAYVCIVHDVCFKLPTVQL